MSGAFEDEVACEMTRRIISAFPSTPDGEFDVESAARALGMALGTIISYPENDTEERAMQLSGVMIAAMRDVLYQAHATKPVGKA